MTLTVPGDAVLGPARGVVERFDAEIGLGIVADDEGRRWTFHCTAIADGTRMIKPGTAVGFHVSWAGPGCWEAFGLGP